MEKRKKYNYTFNNVCDQCSQLFVAKKKTTKLCSIKCISDSNSAKKTKYTPAFIEEIKALRLSGLTNKEVGLKFNMSESSVKTLMSSNGFALPAELASKNMARRWEERNPWINETQLKCATCEKIKEKEEFNIKTDSASGYANVCTFCVNNYNAEYYVNNAPKIKEKVKKYQKEHKEEISEKNREYYQKNKEEAIARANLFAASNPQKRKEYEKKWRGENKKYRNGKSHERRSMISQAMPKNLSKENKNKMIDFFKNCPDGFHVDHVIPINGEIVSGLHVPWNLTYLESSINESKGNKIILDIPVGPCIQYLIRKNTENQDRAEGKPFGIDISDIELKKESYSSIEHKSFIEKYEWLGTVGRNTDFAFVARYMGDLVGIVLISEPDAYMSGDKTIQAQIQRGACASWAPKNLNSKLVMFSCNWMVKNTNKRVFVGYSDFEAGEIGTIYQSCNFQYLGNHFGSRHSYILENGKSVGAKWFCQTNNMKKWAKELGIEWKKEWYKENKYHKDISKIPKEIYKKLKDYSKTKMLNCERIDEFPKGKYMLKIGKDRYDKRKLKKEFVFPSKPYPKRDIQNENK